MSVTSIRAHPVPELPELNEKIIAAERIVLGGMMSGGSDIVTMVAGRLDTDDFLRPAHGLIFDVVCALWANDGPTDPAAVHLELGRQAEAERAIRTFGVDWLYLDGCVGAVPALGNVGWFTNEVAAAGRRRKAASALRTSAGRLDSGADLGEEMDKVRVALDAIEKSPAASWTDPVPLSPLLPEFPTHLLPGTVGRIVRAVAASTQTPPDIAAFTALAVLSAATRGRWTVAVDPEWTEELALYLASLSDSGSRKSAVVREVGRPLFAAEKTVRDDRRASYLEEAASYRILEKRALAAENRAAKADADPSEEAEARDLARQLGETPRPAQFRLTFDDATPEKLAPMMAEQGGPLAVLSAEGGLLGTLAGRYSDSPNVDLVLKAFNGERYQSDRITRDTVDVERPFLAMGLIVQPDVIAAAVKVREFVNRGLLPRMLFSIPRTTVGIRTLEAPAIPADVAEQWAKVVHAIFSQAIDGDGSQTKLTIVAAARTVLDKFRGELEPRLHPELGDLAPAMAWASKLPGALVRIAALFALAADPGAAVVSAEDMSAAVGLAPYLIAHASAAMTLDRRMREDRQAAVLAWIRRKSVPKVPQPSVERGSGAFGTTFTSRDAWRGLHGQAWAQTAADVQAVLDELAGMGWIRRQPDPPRKSGRPASPTYDIHPKALHGGLS